MQRLFLILIPLIFLSSTTSAFASSVTYSIAERMVNASEHFTITLYSSIADAYKPLYYKIATIGLVIILCKYLFTRVVPLMDMFGFTMSMILASNIAFDPAIFKELIYNTFFDLLYSLDQFIVQSAASHLPEVYAIDFNSISGVFKTIDNSLMAISDFALGAASDNSISFGNIFSFVLNKLEAFIIYLLYLFIGAYFLTIFTIAIFGAHMMMILLPITISLYPFKRFRGYLSNCIHGILHYGLVTVFSCVAIAIVIFITNELVQEANTLLAKVSENTPLTIPQDFLTASIMVGFLSIFTIKVSTEFASRVLNSASSQLGGVFPMAIAGATTLAKAAPTIARHTAVPVTYAAYQGAKAVSGIRSQYQQFMNRGGV